jgi:phosphotransferase system enzyme I (PtsI)
MAFVTEHGGVNSHASILARALGIPVVSGLAGIHDAVSCGTEILLDGRTGDVVVWPREETIERLRSESRRRPRLPTPVDPTDGLVVLANVSTLADIADAVEMKAEGVGLYRTEVDVLTAGRLLREDEYYERYAAAQSLLGGRVLTFRLLDLGSDKALPGLQLPSEKNPALGCRGARLLLERPELLLPQARALARVSRHGPVRILYPFIVDREQLLRLRAVVLDAMRPLSPGSVLHGAMFEVPSACLQARDLLEVADFGSIGTNDLTQYLFAADRNSAPLPPEYGPDRPVLWNLIRRISVAAEETGTELSVCGELAGEPKFVPRLIGLGIQRISVSPPRIPACRRSAALLGVPRQGLSTWG